MAICPTRWRGRRSARFEELALDGYAAATQTQILNVARDYGAFLRATNYGLLPPMRLSRAQFEALFEGLDWRRVKGRAERLGGKARLEEARPTASRRS